LETVSRKSTKCKLDLMSIQEVGWNKVGTEPADDYTFLYDIGMLIIT
jgi:hypothetical protein